jgi:hypothetical protein
MESLLRMAAGLLLAALLLAVCCVWQPAWLTALGLDVWALPGLLAQLEEEEQRHEQLTNWGERVRTSAEIKESATRELIAGRMTLAEGAEQFRRAAGPALPQTLRLIRHERQDATDAELLYYHVIDWVKSSLEHELDCCQQVVGRLEEEFCALRPTLPGRSD